MLNSDRRRLRQISATRRLDVDRRAASRHQRRREAEGGKRSDGLEGSSSVDGSVGRADRLLVGSADGFVGVGFGRQVRDEAEADV